MALSDDLVKTDGQIENVTKKIAGQLYDLLDAKENKAESLTVNNSTILNF
jgi:hypothetical protein